MEKAWGRKCPGLGCFHHYAERLEDAAQRHCFGPTSGPEEAVVKKFKAHWNSLTKEAKDLSKVNNQRDNYNKICLSIEDFLGTIVDIDKLA